MKIYSKIETPKTGRRMNLIDPIKRTKLAKVILYDDFPTTVDDSIGKKLMKQDPHIVAKWVDEEHEEDIKKFEAKEDDEYRDPVATENLEKYKDAAQEFVMLGDPEDLTRKQLREFANSKLGMSLAASSRKSIMIESINQRCEKITKA